MAEPTVERLVLNREEAVIGRIASKKHVQVRSSHALIRYFGGMAQRVVAALNVQSTHNTP